MSIDIEKYEEVEQMKIIAGSHAVDQKLLSQLSSLLVQRKAFCNMYVSGVATEEEALDLVRESNKMIKQLIGIKP